MIVYESADNTDAIDAAIYDLGQARGVVDLVGVCRYCKPLRLDTPILFRSTCLPAHITSIAPTGGILFDLPPSSGPVDALTVAAQGCGLLECGVLVPPLGVGGAAVKVLAGAFTMRGSKLHALRGAAPGVTPLESDGRGLVCEGQQSNVRVLQQSYAGGFHVGFEFESTAALEISSSSAIGNRLGVRLGRTGGTSGAIRDCCIQDNAEGGIDVVHTAALEITGLNGEYGVGPLSPWFLRVGRGAVYSSPTNILLRGYLQGNLNPEAAAVVLERVDGLDLDRLTIISGYGPTLDVRPAFPGAVADVRLRQPKYFGPHGPLATDTTGITLMP